MAAFAGLKVTVDRLRKLADNVADLTRLQTLVGIPAEKNDRQAGGRIGNAALLYIHTNGAPEVGIPPRPSMQPAVERKKNELADLFKRAANAALDGRGPVRRIYEMAGIMVANETRAVIQEGIPPPLKPATVAARRRRSKGSKYRRAATAADQQAYIDSLARGQPAKSPTTPLYDTGQLARAVTYVVREGKK